MKISVIIPCHNGEKTIASSLLSVVRQEYKAHEIIVVDDHSEDKSVDLIRASGIDVKLVSAGATGASNARNEGIDVATGNWLAFLDADDLWYPNHLSRAEQFISTHKVVGYLNHYDWVSQTDTIFTKKKSPVDAETTGQGIDTYLNLYLKYKHFVGMSACIVERERAELIGGFDPELVRRHDIDFWLRIIDNQGWFFDPQATSAYRKNTLNSLSSNQPSAALYRYLAFKKNHKLTNSLVYDLLLRQFAMTALIKGALSEKEQDHKLASDLVYNDFCLLEKVLSKVLTQFPGMLKYYKKALKARFRCLSQFKK